MKIFEDILSGEEIVSDSFTSTGETCFGAAGVKVKSKFIMKGGDNFDIGCGDAFGGQGDDEGADDQSEKVIDLIETYRYQETAFTKKDYMTYIKGYMKKVKGKLEEVKPERVDGFMKEAQEMVKWIISTFDEFTFYTPESFECNNLIILSYYDGEDLTPTFVYFMDGLKGVLV